MSEKQLTQEFLFPDQQVYSPREVREKFGIAICKDSDNMRLFTLDEIEAYLKDRNLSLSEAQQQVKEHKRCKKRNVCDHCSLNGNIKVELDGDLSKAKLLVVGEAPGASEEKQGKPFVGQSGQLLRGVLKEVGFKDEDLAFTNVCRCRPPSNRTPTDKEIKTCLNYLKQVLYQFKGLVLAVGATPAKALLGKTSVSSVRGLGFPHSDYEVCIFVTWHPAYVLRRRGTEVEDQFVEDLYKVYTAVYEPPDIQYMIVDSEFKLEKFLEDMRSRNSYVELGFDVETTGLNFHTDTVISLAFSDGMKNYFIPLQHKDSPWKDNTKHVLHRISDLFYDEKYRLIMQNGKFDMRFLYNRFGIQPINFYYDTMVAEYLLEGKYAPARLKQMVWKYTYMGNYQADIFSSIASLSDISLEEIGRYNCFDALVTKIIKDKQWEKLDDLQKLTILQTLSPAQMALVEMEVTGMTLDFGVLKKKTDEYVNLVTKLEEKMRSYNEVKKVEDEKGGLINFNSNDELIKAFSNFGISTKRKTKKRRQMKLDKDSLEEVKNKHPFISELLMYKKKEKILGTYLRKYSNEHVNGRIHCEYSLVTTATGRLASSGPNLQNVRYDTRQVFTAGFDYLIEVDYSQLELRVLAMLSQDKNLLSVFTEGKDIHERTRYAMFGDNSSTTDAIKKEQRVQAKSVNFGVVYLISARSLAKSLKRTTNEAQAWINAFYEEYPGVVEYQRKVKEHVRKYGYIDNPFGRKRWFNLDRATSKEEKEAIYREAVNMPVQGTASDLVITAIGKVWKKMRKYDFRSRLIVEVHDSIMLDVVDEEVENLVELLNETMVDFPEFSWVNCPLEIDVSIGTHWGNLEEI